MDNIRTLIKKSPAPVVIQTLRTTLTLPPAVANGLINDLTKPNNEQKKWIKNINNSFWKGSLIAQDIKYQSDADAIRRLRSADVVIFEIHGGGFRTGHATMYMPIFIKWLNVLKEKHGLDAMIMSVEYGLAPAHKYPEPVLECVKAYKHLTEDLRVPAWKVILSGDSAGGALCLETLVRTYAPDLAENFDAQRTNYKIDLPAGMVLVSPLVTPETTSASWQSNDKYDMVGQQLAKLVFKEYLDYPNVDPDQLPILRLAQIQSGFSRFAPKNALVFVGEKEVMRDDIMNLVEVAERDGHVKVRTCKENYAHDWYLIREIVKQKDKPMLDMYDEVFADFAAYSVAEAAADKEKRRKSKMISMHVEPTKDLQAEINDAASKSATASDKDEAETPTTPIPGDNSKPDEAPSTNTNIPTPVPATAEANTITI